jgi:hypothetical protein
MNLDEGGSSIPYWDEDPHLRQEYESALRSVGAESRMADAFYRRPEGVGASDPNAIP